MRIISNRRSGMRGMLYVLLIALGSAAMGYSINSMRIDSSEKDFAEARAESRLEKELAAFHSTREREKREHIQTIDRLDRLHQSLRQEIELQDAQIRDVLKDYYSADMERLELKQRVQEQKNQLELLTQNRTAALDAIQNLRNERDSTVAEADHLRRQVASLEVQLRLSHTQIEQREAWFRQWVTEQVETIEMALASNGLDVDELMERAKLESEGGRGGPLILESLDRIISSIQSDSHPGDDMLTRLETMQKLMASIPLSPPVERYRLTSRFGGRKDPFTGRNAFHSGLDFAAPKGTTIAAPAAGTVVRSGKQRAYGNLVEIDHGMGITTLYAHLRETSVSEDEKVESGDIIGIIGSTGRSTGRHLHFEVRIDGKPVDPAKFLGAGRDLKNRMIGKLDP